MSKSREVLETWFRRVWTEGDTTAIDELFVPDGEVRGLGKNVLIGPEDFKQFHAAMNGLIGNFVITIEKSVETGDWLSVVCNLQACSRQTGEPVEMTGSVMVRIVDGKITEAYNHWDFLGLFGQLGLLPKQAFDKALAGEKIT